MKRLSPRYKLIFDRPALLVGEQGAVLVDDLFAQGLEPALDQVGRSFGVKIMDTEFEQLTAEKATLQRAGLGFRQKAFWRLDFQDPHRRLICGQTNGYIQGMSGCPSNQLFRRVTPVQAERRFEDGLRQSVADHQAENGGVKCPSAKVPPHSGRFGVLWQFRKARSLRRGFVLIESMMALSLLTLLGLVLFKLSLNILSPRQWVLRQTVTDAYMTYERAYAERIPFEDLLANTSPWPVFPTTTATVVEVGRLPGGVAINGTVTRTRIADTGNYPIDGGSGTVTTNPAAMKVWKAQSVLTYTVGTKTYAKSRTVLRSQ